MPRLAAATDAEKRARDPLTFPEWGQGLTAEQWLERELVLRAHPWSAGEMETWFWKDDAGQTLASCETFRTPASVGDKGGVVYAVASVFTEQALRGRGHATAMIDALNAELSKRPYALGSVLFSDVGARIYERSGYRAFEAFEVVLPPLSGDPAEGVRAGEFVLPGAARPAETQTLLLAPSEEQFDWHLARERFYGEVLGRTGAPFHSVIAGDAYAAWVVSFKEKVLRVLTLEPGSPEALALVLRSAQRMAGQLGLDSVRIWEPHPGFPTLAGERRPRDGELPMARLYGPGRFDWRHIHRVVWV